MRFQVLKRTWPEASQTPDLCVWWEKGRTDKTWYKAENLFFKSESIGDTVDEAVLFLMKAIEINADITIYVGLIARPNTWYDEGTEVFDYSGLRRVTLSEYFESLKTDQILVRGYRSGTQDGELCQLSEFEPFFTTEPVDEGAEV